MELSTLLLTGKARILMLFRSICKVYKTFSTQITFFHNLNQFYHLQFIYQHSKLRFFKQKRIKESNKTKC